MVLPIADQWAVPQYADPMAERSPEGLPVGLRLADPAVVPPTAAHMAEPPSAERTGGQPSLRVALTGPTMALVPLRRGSQLGRQPVPQRLHPLSDTALLLSGTLLQSTALVELERGSPDAEGQFA